jgi:hypothetical protein
MPSTIFEDWTNNCHEKLENNLVVSELRGIYKTRYNVTEGGLLRNDNINIFCATYCMLYIHVIKLRIILLVRKYHKSKLGKCYNGDIVNFSLLWAFSLNKVIYVFTDSVILQISVQTLTA